MQQPDIKNPLEKGIRAARRGKVEPARRLLTLAIQENPNNEEAWLWMARVVDNPKQKAECLHQVLRLNPDNRWASEQLAELEGTAPQPPPVPGQESAQPPPLEGAEAQPTPLEQAPPPVPETGSKYQRVQPPTAPSDIELETLACPKCGGTVEIQGGEGVKTVVCSYCGSILDLTAEQAAIIGSTDKRIKPVKPIDLGMEGTFKEEKHQVIGWLRYEGWDDEDRWRWDEWLLLSASGKYRWLSYDDESGFLLQEKVMPTGPFDPNTANIIPVEGGQASVLERNPARIIALNGELTWQGKVGDKIQYLEAQHGQTRYSVEYSGEELEMLAGERMAEVEVWQAFGRDDLIKALEETQQTNKVYRVLAMFCLALALCSCMAAMVAGVTGSKLYSSEVTLQQGEGNTKRLGPFEITQPGRVHRVELDVVSLPVNNWAVIQVTAIDNENNPHHLFFEEVWSETGVDSDGTWRESDLGGSHLFKPDSGGQYFLELTMDEATVPSLSVLATVDEGVWLGRYFVIFLIISLILAVILFVLSGRGVSRSLIKST